MSSAAQSTRLCRLEHALGVDAVCPEGACPFWEPGGAVLEGRCVVEGIDFGHDRDVARWLLDIRRRLGEPMTREDAGHEFRRALNRSRD